MYSLLQVLKLNNRRMYGYNNGKEGFFRYNKWNKLVELSGWNGTAMVTEGEEETARYAYDLVALPHTATMPADCL